MSSCFYLFFHELLHLCFVLLFYTDGFNRDKILKLNSQQFAWSQFLCVPWWEFFTCHLFCLVSATSFFLFSFGIPVLAHFFPFWFNYSTWNKVALRRLAIYWSFVWERSGQTLLIAQALWVSSCRFCFSAAYLRSASKGCHNAVLLPLPLPSIADSFLKNMISLWYFLLKSTSSALSQYQNESREVPTTSTLFHCCKKEIIDSHLKLRTLLWSHRFCWLFFRSVPLDTMLPCIFDLSHFGWPFFLF